MYADIIFINELINDYLILSIAGYISGHKLSRKRQLAGALSGAFVSTLLMVFLWNVPLGINLISGILLAILMIFISFKPKTRAGFVRLFFYTYSSGFILRGISEFFELHFPTLPGQSVFFICYLLLIGGLKVINLINKNSSRICLVNVSLGNEVKHLHALIDSGNLLYDDVTNLPVSIIDNNELPENFSPEQLRYISFNSLGCVNGTLKIITVPFMCIEHKGEKKLVENMPVGISEYKLSASNSYQMIISPEIINKMEMQI